jgi:hypothetical protein
LNTFFVNKFDENETNADHSLNESYVKLSMKNDIDENGAGGIEKYSTNKSSTY